LLCGYVGTNCAAQRTRVRFTAGSYSETRMNDGEVGPKVQYACFLIWLAA
jgi:hypothetical protein